MNDQPMVSIVSPCYNGEKYISRLFDSILLQTYSNIEFIFVNDGSTDNTENVALSYQSRFEAKGIQFLYVKKENGGVASAVNKGLELFSGEFITFPDSDDWMTEDCIEKKVKALQNNPDCGMVIGTLDVRLEENPNKSIRLLKFSNETKRNIFDDLVMEKGVFVTPIGWMIRSDMFLSVCPGRHIDDSSRMGQNWQLMLPICYSYNCVFVSEVIGYYLVRSNSLSHKNKTIETRYKKEDAYMMLKINALNSIISMNTKQKHEYLETITRKYAGIKLMLAAQMQNKEYIKKEYANIKSMGRVTIGNRVWYLRGMSKFCDNIATLLYFPVRAIKSVVRRVKQR